MIHPPMQMALQDGKIYGAAKWIWATAEIKGLKMLSQRLTDFENQGWDIFGTELLGYGEKSTIVTPGQPEITTGDLAVFAVICRKPKWEFAGNLAPDGSTIIPPQDAQVVAPSSESTQDVVSLGGEDDKG